MSQRFIKYIKSLKGALRQEVLRIFTNWRIYVCIASITLVCFCIKWDSSMRGAFWAIEQITGISNISYLMAIVAAFPTICCFCDDWLGHYTFPAVSRSGKNTYLHAKILVTYLVSFLIAFIGVIVYEFAELLWLNPGQESNVSSEQLYYDILQLSPVLFIMVRVMMYSAVIALQSLMGLMISAILPNRFVAVLSPVVMYICFENITDILPKNFNIGMIENGRKVIEAGSAGNIIFSLCVILFYAVIIASIFCKIAGGRIKNEIV
ncbi:MAG: hypothetical protein HFJ03_00075 [Lachnospira sp.]|jgi:hypothetical protein|nr:hypothetical protein [Lachnospira sp.]